MTRRLSLRPSILVLALVAALALGSTGSATAAGLTAKTVKKIAAKVVDKKASGLSVAHAATAGSATTATTATNATNATNATTAGNATNLGGLASSSYRDRIVQSSSTSSTNVAGADQTQVLNPTSIDVPAGVGFVRIDAAVGIAPVGNAQISMWIQQGPGVCVANGADFEARQFGHSSTQDSISLTRVVSATPGSSPIFRMCIEASADSQVDNRNLVLQTVALAG